MHARNKGWQTCQKCPPKSFCANCARINRQRHYAGLIYGYADPRLEPSPESTAMVLLQGKYRGGRRANYKNAKMPVVTAYIKQLGGGWRKGAAMLNGVDVYVQPKPTRSMDEAWNYANTRMKLVKAGLRFEAGL